MRESGERRDTVPPWSDAQISGDDASGGDVANPAFAVGGVVRGAIDDYPGSVVSVDASAGTFEVRWADGMYPITYPLDTTMVRKAMPWE